MNSINSAACKTWIIGSAWREYGGILPVLAGTGLIGFGWITDGRTFGPAGLFVVFLVLLSGLHYLHRRTTEAAAGAGVELQGGLLLLSAAWIVYRLGEELLPSLLLLPAAVLAWVVARYSWPVAGTALVVALGMEAGRAAAGPLPGRSGASLIFLLGLALAARYFPGSRLYREKLRVGEISRQREEQEREQAREFGLETDATPGVEILLAEEPPSEPSGFSLETLTRLSASFELVLEMLRQALGLTTVAVLWPSPDGSELRLRYLATTRSDIERGPYPPGSGIAGILNRQETAELAPLTGSAQILPYYRSHQGVGGVLALRIPEEAESLSGVANRRMGILCVDREAAEPWNNRERLVLQLAARKLGFEVVGSRRLLKLDRDRAAVHRLSLSLKELNGGISLESVFLASVKALRGQAQLDLVAFCLLEEDSYRLVQAEGDELEGLIGSSFSLGSGLVGQVIRTGSVLPPGGRYPKPAPIFSNDRTFAEYKSLLIFPLRNELGEALGALVTAARPPGIFTRNRREMLELIAAQVAIKIELAQAHEQLNRLATTDGLTGLVNHRSFQAGFSVMLERAKRNRQRLCLLMADLDHFKQVNDNYGHPFGDLVLRQVARVMAETVRAVDLAARYGGEEFALVLENCDATGGLQLAERIRHKIEKLQLLCRGLVVPVTISLGLAVFPEDGGAKDLLISRADQALYRAKGRGRNRTVIWLASDEE